MNISALSSIKQELDCFAYTSWRTKVKPLQWRCEAFSFRSLFCGLWLTDHGSEII